eukprot:CAMPEP_0174820524 /NCGR_PEP_ID=MMETSP1107-20130205/4421_1 /TAXON_ID=36770 /ORGANISM="Paraphysomonas vestita, Strain GFlagA" /LENGTH=37 /DNA_ID= /DNA_START= /DNA_END= /DNA_ORIENTATION=
MKIKKMNYLLDEHELKHLQYVDHNEQIHDDIFAHKKF